MEETDRNASHNGRYVEPYETSEKWGNAVTELGGIPLTYFQTGYRSEDYAKQYPGHMLFNKTYAWKGEPVDTAGEIFTKWENTWTRNGRVVWGYDYTDPEFLDHLTDVYKNLKKGNIKAHVRLSGVRLGKSRRYGGCIFHYCSSLPKYFQICG